MCIKTKTNIVKSLSCRQKRQPIEPGSVESSWADTCSRSTFYNLTLGDLLSERELNRRIDSWPSWALLRYLEATAALLEAKLGDLEGKLLGLSGGRVQAQLGYFVRPFCCFCSQKCPAPAGPRFEVGFCKLFGSKYGYLMAPLVPFWGQFRRFWDHFAISGLC